LKRRRRGLCENQWNDESRLGHTDEERNIEGKEHLDEGDILLLLQVIIIVYLSADMTG